MKAGSKTNFWFPRLFSKLYLFCANRKAIVGGGGKNYPMLLPISKSKALAPKTWKKLALLKYETPKIAQPDLPAPRDRGDAETWSWIFRVPANTGSQNRLDLIQNDVEYPIVHVSTWRTVAHLWIAYICSEFYWTISVYVIAVSNCIFWSIWWDCMIIFAFYHLHNEYAFQRICFLQISRKQTHQSGHY